MVYLREELEVVVGIIPNHKPKTNSAVQNRYVFTSIDYSSLCEFILLSSFSGLGAAFCVMKIQIAMLYRIA
jgi:hypothetical protein